MSETQKIHVENGAESEHTAELEAKQQEVLRDVRERAEHAKHAHAERLDTIRHTIEKEAEDGSKHRTREATSPEEPEAENTYWYSKEYKLTAFNQLLTKTREHLNPAEKAASKIVHQPIIEAISEVGGKTVARPSGVLLGSVFSFISSLVVYYFSKMHGYDMAYSVFIFAFIGGFVLGVAVEFGYRAVRSLFARD